MVSGVYFSPICSEIKEFDTKPKSDSSLLGRMIPSWEKMTLLSNLIVIVAGIAYAFFALKLPFLAFSLGIYGIAYVGMHKAMVTNRHESLREEVKNLKKEIKEEKIALQKLKTNTAKWKVANHKLREINKNLRGG